MGLGYIPLHIGFMKGSREKIGSMVLDFCSDDNLAIHSLSLNYQMVKFYCLYIDKFFSRAMSDAKSDKFYGVAHGRKPGVYENWSDVQEQVGYALDFAFSLCSL